MYVAGSPFDRSPISNSTDSGFSIQAVVRKFSSREADNAVPPTDTEQAPGQSVPSIDVEELINAYQANELAADRRFAGKRLKITGVVEKIDTDLFNDSEYTLEMTGGGDFEILSVSCRGLSKEVLVNLNPGDPITVIGDVNDGGDLGVIVENCRQV
jgi:hypothetical protein